MFTMVCSVMLTSNCKAEYDGVSGLKETVFCHNSVTKKNYECKILVQPDRKSNLVSQLIILFLSYGSNFRLLRCFQLKKILKAL